MKRHGPEPPDTRGAEPQPRRAVRPADEAAGDRSYGDRASAADPSPAPARERSADGQDLRERYDATVEAAGTVRRGRGVRRTRGQEGPAGGP